MKKIIYGMLVLLAFCIFPTKVNTLEIDKSNSSDTKVDIQTDQPMTKYVLVDTFTKIKERIGYPDGQPRDGYSIKDGGSLIWIDGSSSRTQTFGFNTGSGVVTLSYSVSVGSIRNNVSGVAVEIPPCPNGEGYKALLYKDLEIKVYEVYRKNRYEPETAWKLVGHDSKALSTKYYLEAERVS